MRTTTTQANGTNGAMRKFMAAAIMVGTLAAAAQLYAQQPEVKPGPEHQMLKEEEGVWDAAIKTPTGESKGPSSYKMALNGLWLLELFEGTIEGMPFEGRGATSYDPAKKKFVNVWIDSMSTSPLISEGTYNQGTKTMTLVGDMPMPDGKSMKVSMITVMKDANTKSMKLMAAGPDGKEAEMLQINLKRRVEGKK